MDRRYLVITLVAVTSLAAYPLARATTAASTTQTAARTRIGIFDSRCVAVAYYNAPEFQKEMQQMRVDLSAAKAANNKAKIDDLEFAGPAIQSLLHYQVFSNASIPNVLDKLSAVLPKVAADARVSVIVSKWDIAFKNADVDYIDVTDALVRTFNPTAKMLQGIEQMKGQTPMPLLDAVKTLRPDR